MPRIEEVSIAGFRSIGDKVILKFPEKMPIVLIGENNAGKSNIIRAIDLLFGEFHPKYKKLEDYDYFDRNPKYNLEVSAKVSDFKGKLVQRGEYECRGFKFSANYKLDNEFVAIQNDGNENKYVSNQLREEMLCIVVNSEQNLGFQLSYSSKYTLLSKVTKAFHNELVDDSVKVELLKQFFEEIKSTFLTVEKFKEFSDNMSTIAKSVMSNMSHSLEFDFSAYDPSNYFKTLKIHPTENGDVRAFEELGTGQQQILAISLAHAYAKSFLGQGIILILDEPESHLHPLAQKWLAKQMFKMAEDGLQIIITTHSPYFINLKYLEGINLIRKDSGSTYNVNVSKNDLYLKCLNTGANRSKITEENIVPFYNNSSTFHLLTGFFANKIILVEGQTEELSLPVYFERLKYDTTEFGIEVIGVSGKGNLAKWWRFFTLYQIPTFVCFDNDSDSDEDGIKRKDALNTIGIPESELSMFLNSNDWSINEKFCVFGKDFETTIRKSFEDYLEKEVSLKKELGSSSKHLIARETAIQINLEKDSLGKLKMLELIEKIKNLKI